jgi:hypothetical protein
MSLLDDENILIDDFKESSKPINILNSYFQDKNTWDRQLVENIFDNILPNLPVRFRWEIDNNSLFCICDKSKTDVKSCPLYIRFCSDFDKKYCYNPVDYEVHVYLEEVNGEASENTKIWISIQDEIFNHLKIDKRTIKYHKIIRAVNWV